MSDMACLMLLADSEALCHTVNDVDETCTAFIWSMVICKECKYNNTSIIKKNWTGADNKIENLKV